MALTVTFTLPDLPTGDPDGVWCDVRGIGPVQNGVGQVLTLDQELAFLVEQGAIVETRDDDSPLFAVTGGPLLP